MAENNSQNTAQNHQASLRKLAVVLFLAGILLAVWRYLSGPESVAAPGDRLWDVELTIRANSVAGKTAVEIAAPLSTRNLRVIGQNISHFGWRQNFKLRDQPDSSRRIAFTASRDGDLAIEAIFSIHALAVPRLSAKKALTLLEGGQRETYLQDHPTLQIDDPEVKDLVASLVATTTEAESLPDLLYEAVRRLRERGGEGLRPVPEILSARQASDQERAYTLVALARAARIPARLVKGLVLKESTSASLHFWAELHVAEKWTPYDPVFGYRHELPINYLPILKGPGDVVAVSGTSTFAVGIAVTNTDPLLELAESTRETWLEVLDLTRLSLDTRLVLAALMLLPLGALLTALFNGVIGVRSYGVFTPTLLALSLVYVPWQSASVVLLVVLSLGVVGRAAIPGELSRVPRLSIVLTLVALGIAASASLMEYFELGFGGQLMLLPIVILASLVDRFYAVFDEKGLRTALYRLWWTLLLAILCMPIVQWETLGHALVRYPELHLITLATMLGLTLYGGRRVAQLPGFGWLNWPESVGAGGSPSARSVKRRDMDPD